MADTVNKIRIVFTTEANKSMTISFNYAAEALTTEEGAATVQSFVDFVLDNQPFTSVLTDCQGAEFTITTTQDIDLSSASA